MLIDKIFEVAFHGSPIGQYLLAPTDQLEILAVNDAFLRSVARRREDVLGRPLFEVFPNNPTDPHDTGVQDLARSIRDAIEAGASQKMAAQRYPIEMERDGRRWFEIMYWSATNTPVYGDDGRLLCVSHTTIDITAQVLAEQALERSREEALASARRAEAERANLAAVLSAAPVGILVVDRAQRVIEKNPAYTRLFGNDFADIGARIDLDVWNGWLVGGPRAGDKLRLEDWPLQRALAGETVDHCPLRVQSFDADAVRTMLVSSAPIHGADGEVVGAVAVAMDIEERIRAEQALQEADRRKDEFLAMLAHELRNPLAPIGAAASLLARSHGEDEQVQRTSKVITRQVQHMSSLVNELLDVARVTRGLIALDREILDAKRIVAEAIEQARPGIEARGHTLQVSQPPLPAFVLGDHKRLVQVLANLLHNAAKFTPEGGLVQVELEIDPNHVRLCVSDNGQGMTPELMARAFELFAQGERTLDRSQGGLGIGLALVRSVVQLHGGRASVESAGPDQGSHFTICLPKAEPPAPARPADADASAAAGAAAAAQQGLAIMAVDDNEDAVTMLQPLLASLGHRVTTFTSSRAALGYALAHPPDACVLDIGLPEIDGLALARALRADPRTRGAVLIALSGYGKEVDRRAALAAGFDDYFVKPVNIDALGEALARPAPGRQAEPR
ncbi:ATP-binding protein [Massilia sp. 9096]|uniref:PAS domain-containing hybrid sensor histidine kinase/response regulator n=1 Tax=Massilia sp. 9096 TaxID=1500894 RepID=UPI0006917943|nr:ATP-binding protein [Massilia sp. 9096]